MMMFDTLSLRTAFAAVAASAVILTATDAAVARCTRLAFSVNDYGKDGPIKDAKALLDTYVAKWAAERGIKNYTTGKKDVSCELFLDFGVFDEHTCKAAATVCWPGDAMPAPIKASAPDADGKPAKAAPRTAVKPATPKATKTAAPADATSPVTTGSVPAPAAAAPVAPAAAPSGPPTAPEPVAPAASPPAKTE